MGRVVSEEVCDNLWKRRSCRVGKGEVVYKAWGEWEDSTVAGIDTLLLGSVEEMEMSRIYGYDHLSFSFGIDVWYVP